MPELLNPSIDRIKDKWSRYSNRFRASPRFYRLLLVLLPLALLALSNTVLVTYQSYAMNQALKTFVVRDAQDREIEIDTQLFGSQLEEFNRQLVVQKIFPISVVVFILFALTGISITNRLFDPVKQLVHAAQQMTFRQWDINFPSDAPGEIGLLADAFLKMKIELQSVLSNLEDRVAERTRALARRTVHLQTASEVARDVIATRNFETLLNRIVNLLSDRFGYYHVGVFLIDLQGDYAVLQAAPGEIGKEMLEQGHRLRVGSSTIVGFVASSGEPRYIQNNDLDPFRLFNPLLPHTKSELGLPLVVDQRVIGVLDVQSIEEGAFDQEEIDVLQTLADQLAIAIDTAKLYQEYIDLIHQFENLQNQISHHAWENISKSKQIRAYQKDASGLKTLTQKDLKNVGNDAPPYSMPIKVRGEIVSYLDIWPSGETLSSDEEILLNLLKDRIAQAVESARLFEETQIKARHEQAVNEFVIGLSSSLDLQSLIQAAVKQYGALPGISGVELRINPEDK